jgi:hypothetical protein
VRVACRLIPGGHNAAGGGGDVALTSAASRPTFGLHFMSTGDPPPRAAARRNSNLYETSPGQPLESAPSHAGPNGSPTSEHTTSISTARDAALALVGTLYDLSEVCRAAEPVSIFDRMMMDLGQRLVGVDCHGGLRAELERALSRCREAVTPFLNRLAATRQLQGFDLEETTQPTATEWLLDRAERAHSRLEMLNRFWRGKAVSDVCELLYGVLHSIPTGGQRRWFPILPQDIPRLRTAITLEFAPLLVAEAERPVTSTAGADGPYRDGPTDFGVRWRGQDIRFDRAEENGWKVVEAMWPPAQGKRLRAEQVKVKIGSKARNPKWAVNVASTANKVLGKYRLFPFKLVGGKEGGVEYLQWDEVSAGTQ